MDVIKGAICLEGGSLRGLFTAGVLDALLDNNIHIEYVNGVSAGSMNGMNYVSRQRGRSKRINLKYLHDKRYISYKNMLTQRQIFNFDFLFGDISNKYDPFDWKAFTDRQQKYEAVATEVISGNSVYFNLDNCSDIIAGVEGSSSMPVLSRMIDVDGKKYLDGGVSVPIAYKRAFELGYDRAVVVLTRERGYRKKPVGKMTERMYRRYFRPLPRFTDKLMGVPERYNRIQEEMEELKNSGRLLIIRPQRRVIVKRLEHSAAKLESLYNEGYEEGMKNIDKIREFFEAETGISHLQ